MSSVSSQPPVFSSTPSQPGVITSASGTSIYTYYVTSYTEVPYDSTRTREYPVTTVPPVGTTPGTVSFAVQAWYEMFTQLINSLRLS